MRILLNAPHAPTIKTTLEAFLSLNDDFRSTDAAAIRALLMSGATFRGGGGAAPAFTLRKAPA